MRIIYDAKTDLLYLRIDDRKQETSNQRLTESIVLDIGEEGKIVGIEILDASKNVNLEKVLPINYKMAG